MTVVFPAISTRFPSKFYSIQTMIATILKSSAHFSAVDYNERKVAKGTAQLIEVQNFGFLQGSPNFNADNIKEFLIDYSKRNQNIKNTQMHLAISCKGHKYTEEQLLDIAHKWLKKMGYGEEGQPLLIYAHRDTGNTHIHIVTSRVAPDGHKIDHNHERVRSQAVLNEIMGIDNKKEVKNFISEAIKYRFSTIGQYRAVIESSGYETYTEGNELNIKKDGIVLDHISLDEIKRHFSKEEDDEKQQEEIKKRKKQLWAILSKYRDLSADKEELTAQLKKSFGISLVFMGSKDSPYGYTLVDHKNKVVYKGSEIMNIKKLLNFDVAKRDPEDVKNFINEQLKANPNIDSQKLNKLLWHKYHASISKSSDLKIGTKHYTLDEDVSKLLKANNKVVYVQSFHPTNAMERDLLCDFFHVEKDRVKIEKDYKRSPLEDVSYKNSVDNIKRILGSSVPGSAGESLHDNGIGIIRDGEKFYGVDMKNHHFVNMASEGIDTSPLIANKHVGRGVHYSQGNGTNIGNKASQLLRNNDTGHNANREWEVGSNNDLDDIDDERRLKR